MKNMSVSLSLLLLSAISHANPSTIFYIGESTVTMNSGQVYTSSYLDARTSDETKNTISEDVVSQGRNGFQESSAVMEISGDHFTMTEATGTVTGSGDLTGIPWKWTFLKAEFKIAASGMRIIDYNFLADPNSIQGHKDFYISSPGQGESLYMQEDVVLHPVSVEEFSKKKAELLDHSTRSQSQR